MEMKGLSSYSGTEALADRRQAVATASANTNTTSANLPAADTTQFRQPNTLPPALNPMLAPVNILQFLGAGFDRLASLAATFFKGLQKDIVDEAFEDRWEQNELSNPDWFDQHAKVKDAQGSNWGGGGQ